MTPYGMAYLTLLLVAFAMRFWDLGAMALHHDESLHAIYSWYLYEGRGYQHMPMMHGPFQFFGTAGLYHLLGDSNYVARVLPAIFGTLLVAMPFLLRSHLGRAGTLVTSVLLAFSPVMLYYSRFARNDIYMAVWVLALVAFMWRYLDTRKTVYLVLGALALAMAFSTKETAYISAVVIGSYLFLATVMDVFPWLLGRKALRRFSPPGDVLVLMATLLLPLSAAMVSLLQGPLGITLANPDWTRAAVGIPLGPGLYVAFLAVVGTIGASVVVGLRWRPRVWLLCTAVFWTVWVLLYTTFFTNFWGGLGSGLWQSLGYWVAQQGVARGGQPWYYYQVIGLNYEFLPLLVGSMAAAFYAIRGNRFERFLAYWALLNLLGFIYASEKMPWLLAPVMLPFILLAGKLLGGLLEKRPWSRQRESPVMHEKKSWLTEVHWPAVSFTIALALVVAVCGGLLLQGLSGDRDVAALLFLGVALLALAAGLAYVTKRVGKEKRWALFGASLVAVMFGLTVPTAVRAAYANADVPVEMLVYTQSAPDIPQLMAKIDQLAEETGKGKDLKVLVDSADGFSWPWAWYLRDYRNVSYPCLTTDAGCSGLSFTPDADVVLLSERSRNDAAPYMGAYGEPVRYKHRWWFPESYRGMTLKGVWNSVQSRESVCKVAAYFIFREFGQPLGSVDAYAYFPQEYDVGKVGKELPEKRVHC